MAPGVIAYTWLGFAGRVATAGNGSAIQYGLLTLGLLAAIAFLPRLFGHLKAPKTGLIDANELNTQIGNGKALTVLGVQAAMN